MMTMVQPQKVSSKKSELEVRRTFVLKNVQGLHARPAALLAHALQNYACRVTVQCGEFSADPRSIFGVLSLAAGYDSKLTFVATGADANRAIEEVEHLFRTNFQ